MSILQTLQKEIEESKDGLLAKKSRR